MPSLPPFDYFQHRRACQRKQADRASRIANLPFEYHTALTDTDRDILGLPIGELVKQVQDGTTSPTVVLRAYGKVAIKAHEKTNCLTEVLFADAEQALEKGEINLKGPLAGIPVSMKDSIMVKGSDTTIGYSKFVGDEAIVDGVLVKLLREAGAVPFVKTNLPITLLSFESFNDVWGRTKNPHNTSYSPGGSTGGEAALLASGGSRIGVGSDVAGSVRVPAHWSGCYSLRCSTGRWPKAGIRTSIPGQEGVQSVFSPMARTMDDLRYFTRELIKMEPWRFDGSVHPLKWRDEIEQEFGDKKVLKVGVLRDDGVVPPSPACLRALDTVVSALTSHGHIVETISPPSPYNALCIASSLVNADGSATFLSHFRSFESNDPGARQLSLYASLPRVFRYMHYLWVRYVRRDAIWAGLLQTVGTKSAEENFVNVTRREDVKAQWHSWWNEGEYDVLIAPPNATPALPHGAMADAVSSCGYTFLFNLLDYSAGIIPATKVDASLDALPANFNKRQLNGVARGAYRHYDAIKMAGLPVGVQVVGRRLEEEKVLAVMTRIEDMLEAEGKKYELLKID